MNLLPMIRCDCADLTTGRNNLGALDNLRAAIFIQHGYKRFADRKLSKDCLNFEFRVLPKSLGGGLNCLLIARCERAQGVLHAVTELAKNDLGNIQRILANEVNADAF